MSFETNNPNNVGLAIAGVPTNGTACVQTLTIGGTPTGGGFTLACGGFTSSLIVWSATDADLESNIATALAALPGIGRGNVAVTAGTGSSGIGTYLITFVCDKAASWMPDITVAGNVLTGTAPTVAISTTTPGIPATLLGAERGTVVTDRGAGRSYANMGTPVAPQWVRCDQRVAVIPLTGVVATTGGAVGSWAPPEGGPVLITRAILRTTTKSTGAATVDVGIAADAVTSDDTLLDGLDIGTATVLADNHADGGTHGKPSRWLPAGSYVTATGSADTSGLVGTLYLFYFKP